MREIVLDSETTGLNIFPIYYNLLMNFYTNIQALKKIQKNF